MCISDTKYAFLIFKIKQCYTDVIYICIDIYYIRYIRDVRVRKMKLEIKSMISVCYASMIRPHMGQYVYKWEFDNGYFEVTSCIFFENILKLYITFIYELNKGTMYVGFGYKIREKARKQENGRVMRSIEAVFLPREEDKIMSGYFGFVAICVTHPLWPRSVPRSCRVSVILNSFQLYYTVDADGFYRPIATRSNIKRKRKYPHAHA